MHPESVGDLQFHPSEGDIVKRWARTGCLETTTAALHNMKKGRTMRFLNSKSTKTSVELHKLYIVGTFSSCVRYRPKDEVVHAALVELEQHISHSSIDLMT